MKKRERPGECWLVLGIFCLMILTSGCIEGGNRTNGSSPATSPGLNNTPSAEVTSGSGAAPIITPNETNVVKGTIIPAPELKRYLFSLEVAPQLTVQPLFVVTDPPQGFLYRGGSLDSNGVISLTLSNTERTVTFIQAPHWSDVGVDLSGTGVRYRPLSFNNLTCFCSEAEGLDQLFWNDGDRDYYLIGELECDDLLPMAGSLKPLDYEILDRLPYAVSDPENPFPNPERIRLLFPLAWIEANKYHSRMTDIAISQEEFDASFSPDPRDPSILRHRDVREDEPVVYLTLPSDLFDQFSVKPGEVRIRYPNEYFQYFGNMESLYEAHRKDPDPPGWKPRIPDFPGTSTMPATPVP